MRLHKERITLKIAKVMAAVILSARLSELVMPYLCSGYADRAWAAGQVITLSQVQSLAIANSADYKKVLNKIELQEIKYAAAVKSVAMKKKNKSSFRWSPLLNFKFPQQADFSEGYEWEYKPLQISTTITELRHQLTDIKIESREVAALKYIEAYVCQEKIAFWENSLERINQSLERNRAKLLTGEATQNDIDRMEQKAEALTSSISLQTRTLESAKSSLSSLINLDITTGYTFENPFVEEDIPRSVLPSLIDYTLENDHGYYETKMETQLLLTSLNTMYSLMHNQYGKKMNGIDPYINQVKSGEDVDSAAFKRAYNDMLQETDKPWSGSIRILFFRFTLEWFKGEIDGTRYVEDDPYALYAQALDYADGLRDQNSEKQQLISSVKTQFENVKTARTAYLDGVKAADELADEIKKDTELNRLGSLSYEELSDVQDEYLEAQIEELDQLAEYSKLLYSFDRLTCGGITEYLNGTNIDMRAAAGGNSFIADELNGKAYYYIHSIIEDNMFVFGVSIPEDFSVDLTDYELYVDGIRIGDKTKVTKEIEHLALALDKVESAKVYLYDGDELVEVCEIDAQVNQAELSIVSGYSLAEKSVVRTVALYQLTIDSKDGIATLSLTAKDTEKISYYRLCDESGNAVLGEELIPIKESFQYLSLLAGDLSQVRVIFYDSAKSELYTGSFETGSASIVVDDVPK